ncbi:MAG: ribbon-helix-helix protein, CopG family [Candidatus Limnocylindria bacterium]
MRRTSILLDPGLLAELERLGRRQGRPTAHVMREALEEYVAAQRDPERSLPGFVGIGHGPADAPPADRPLADADAAATDQEPESRRA